jgi:hypothetical protein
MKVKVRRVSIHLYLLVPRPLPAWPSARSIPFQRFIDTLTSLKLPSAPLPLHTGYIYA